MSGRGKGGNGLGKGGAKRHRKMLQDNSRVRDCMRAVLCMWILHLTPLPHATQASPSPPSAAWRAAQSIRQPQDIPMHL